jgi:hypothetical protein
VRIAFYVLLALNLVYLAWAGWVDTPAAPPVIAVATPKLPELALAPRTDSSADTSLARPVSGNTPGPQPVGATEDETLRAAAAPARCVSVGPFNDLTQAARGAALLRDRGFDPKQRAEQGDTWEGFWVYVGVKSAADETKLMKALDRAGISDAHAMPEGDDGRRVSVGLFTEKDRAEKRAQAVKRLGYSAEIVERKQTGSVYWVDIDLGANDHTVPTEGLLSIGDAGSRLEIRVCPGNAPAPAPAKPTPVPRDARPAATTADAGAPRPG